MHSFTGRSGVRPPAGEPDSPPADSERSPQSKKPGNYQQWRAGVVCWSLQRFLSDADFIPIFKNVSRWKSRSNLF